MTTTLEKSSVGADILDRIDVRYRVGMRFEFGEGTPGFFVATADASITAGVYDGIGDFGMIAGLVSQRGIYGDDLDLVGTDLDRNEVADMITARGIRAEDVRTFHIDEVMIDDEVVATSGER